MSAFFVLFGAEGRGWLAFIDQKDLKANETPNVITPLLLHRKRSEGSGFKIRQAALTKTHVTPVTYVLSTPVSEPLITFQPAPFVLCWWWTSCLDKTVCCLSASQTLH